MESKTKIPEEMSREELIAEVRRLRRPPAGGAEGRPQGYELEYRHAPREELSADIEFIFDLDVVRAKGLDISESGIAFRMDQAPPVELKLQHQGRMRHYLARLVRTQKLEQGGFMLGLELRGEAEYPPLLDEPEEDEPPADF